MQQLKVIIADDEPIARDILEGYVAKVPSLLLAGCCKNSVDVFEQLNKQEVDLLFLDINMPEITGIDLLKALRNPPMVIFTTAYSEYAVESYQLDAVDYLLKPIPFDRFITAIHKAQHLASTKEDATQDVNKVVFVKSGTKLIRVDLEDVIYVEAMKDYVKICTSENTVMVHSTMKNIEQQLSAYTGFLRVSKSYIINTEKVNALEGNIIYANGYPVTIGNTYRDKVLDVLTRNRLI